MTQNFLINTSYSYYDPKLPTVSPGNCSHMKCHHLLSVLQEYQVSASDSCQHISCRGYLRHFVIFIIHDFSALSRLMLPTGHWPNLFKILYFEFSIKFTNMVRISGHRPQNKCIEFLTDSDWLMSYRLKCRQGVELSMALREISLYHSLNAYLLTALSWSTLDMIVLLDVGEIRTAATSDTQTLLHVRRTMRLEIRICS